MQLRLAGAALAALVSVVPFRSLHAQSKIGWLAGGGVSLPSGEFNAYANKGWAITVGAERRLGNGRVALRIDGTYARNTDTTGVGFHEDTRLMNVMANVVYHFRGAQPRIYFLAGAGVFARRFSTNDEEDPSLKDTYPGFQVGEGILFRVKSATLFLEARFVASAGKNDLQFVPVVLGVRFGDSRIVR